MPNEIKTNLYFPFEVLWGIVSQQTHHGLESHYILYAWKTGLHHQPKTHKKRKINVTRDFMIQGIFEARLFFSSHDLIPHALLERTNIGSILHLLQAGGQDGQTLLIKVIQFLLLVNKKTHLSAQKKQKHHQDEE